MVLSHKGWCWIECQILLFGCIALRAQHIAWKHSLLEIPESCNFGAACTAFFCDASAGIPFPRNLKELPFFSLLVRICGGQRDDPMQSGRINHRLVGVLLARLVRGHFGRSRNRREDLQPTFVEAPGGRKPIVPHYGAIILLLDFGSSFDGQCGPRPAGDKSWRIAVSILVCLVVDRGLCGP